jgi:hypothetical protein
VTNRDLEPEIQRIGREILDRMGVRRAAVFDPGHWAGQVMDRAIRDKAFTGTIVGRQPFGGFRHSGVGSNAGGPDYLPQFLIPNSYSENTRRHGLAPTIPL